jgi:hypothetical protein
MGKNSKPILSVLVDEDKKEKFADLARRNKYSMGWLVNDAIDRMLAANSIDIYSDSTGVSAGTSIDSPSPHISIGNIDNLVKASIDKQFVGATQKYIEELTKTYIDSLKIEETIKNSIGNLDIEELIKPYVPNLNTDSISAKDVEEIVKTSISLALQPIEAEVAELKKPLAIG